MKIKNLKLMIACSFLLILMPLISSEDNLTFIEKLDNKTIEDSFFTDEFIFTLNSSHITKYYYDNNSIQTAFSGIPSGANHIIYLYDIGGYIVYDNSGIGSDAVVINATNGSAIVNLDSCTNGCTDLSYSKDYILVGEGYGRIGKYPRNPPQTSNSYISLYNSGSEGVFVDTNTEKTHFIGGARGNDNIGLYYYDNSSEINTLNLDYDLLDVSIGKNNFGIMQTNAIQVYDFDFNKLKIINITETIKEIDFINDNIIAVTDTKIYYIKDLEINQTYNTDYQMQTIDFNKETNNNTFITGETESYIFEIKSITQEEEAEPIQVFNIDYSKMENVYLTIMALGVGVLFFFLGNIAFSGFIFFLMGFLMLFSGVNLIISMLMITAGTIIIFMLKGGNN